MHHAMGLLRCDRSDGRGGGVAVAFKTALSDKISPIDLKCYGYDITNPCFELMAFDFYKNAATCYRFICVYLPPTQAINTNQISALLNILNRLVCDHEVFILGDFNCNDINWSLSPVLGYRQSSKIFLNFLSSNNLFQVINESTHNQGNTLDLVITSCVDKITKAVVREPLTPSNDHHMIEIELGLEFFLESNQRKHNFFLANYTKINEYLSKVDWPLLLDNLSDVNLAYIRFINTLKESIEKLVPYSNTKQKPKIPTGLKHLLQLKKRFYKLSKSDPAFKPKYKYYESLYKLKLKEINKDQENKIINSKSKNLFYSYVNKKLRKRNFLPPLQTKNGDIVIDSEQKAKIFNDYFLSVFITDDGKLPTFPPPSNSAKISQMSPVIVTSADIIRSVKSLNNTASITPENIPAIFLKNTVKSLIYPLCYIFNLSILSQSVPDFWKEALVVPIHKKGLKNSPMNYRPVSMTSVFGRVEEKIIHTKTMTHLTHNELLCSNQHGFVPKRSTLSQHIEIVNMLTDCRERKTSMDTIFLDFSKAFDRVSHSKLMHVLSFYKLDPNVLNWIKQFLHNRKQRTVVNGRTSEYQSISSGVPQGTVLGPLLFSLYLNSLLESLKRESTKIKTFAFADDVKLMGDDLHDMKKCLHIVEKWAKEWQLTVQPEKSEYIRFFPGNNDDSRTFHFDGNSIKQSGIVKDLGIIFSEDLSWQPQLQALKSKAERVAYIILRIFKTKNPNIYTSAFKTYVRPLIEYNTSVWSPYKKGEKKIIESVQKTFSKKVCQRLNLSFSDYSDRLKLLQLDSLEYRRLEFDLILLYKILNGHVLIDLGNELTYSDLNSKYNLRRNTFQIKNTNNFKNDIRYNYFINRTVKVWNKLPQYVVEAKTPLTFKQKLHHFNLRQIAEFVF